MNQPRGETPAERTPGDETLLGRLLVALAALICLVFTGSLYDTLLHLPLPPPIPAPPVPEEVGERDAQLTIEVVDEGEHRVERASVRVFAIRNKKAYFAGDRDTGPDGKARFAALPRGEVWVLAYGPGRSRASLKAVLEQGEREERLTLHAAQALDVIVVDDNEHPVPGAIVEAQTADPLPYQAITGEDGAARVDRLGPPPYRVRVSKRGYDDTVKGSVIPGKAPLRLRLSRLASLLVSVKGIDGQPAKGATVLCAGTGLWPARSTQAGDDGKALISGLHGGAYDLVARLGDDVSPTEFAVPAPRGEVKAVELVLEKGKRVSITVTDGPGEDAPRIKNAAVVLAESGLSSFPLQGRTNEQGVVVLGPIGRTSAAVSARAEGFVERSAVAVEAEATEARVSLVRGGVLVGDVVDDRGFPVPGATIEVIGVDDEGLPIDVSSTMIDFRDEHFEATLGGPRPLVPMGELGVMPGPIPDFPHGMGSFSDLPPGTGLGGTTEPGSNALAGGAARGGDPWVTARDGTFRASPVPPGRVHALVRHPSYVETLSEVVTVRSGAESTVHVVLRQGGWIEGRVIEEDKMPVAGARVELAATHGSLELVAYTADDGTFTFASAPDEVLLSVARAEAPSEIVARGVVDVPDRDRREVEIVLPKARDTVSIRVDDDRGYPIDRAEIRAVSLELDAPLRRTLFTDRDGIAALPNALGLPLRLTLLRPGKAPRVEVVESAPKELTLVLAEGVRAHGQVTAREGRDRIAGAEVTVFTASGARHTKTDDEGTYTLDDLAPGRVRIRVSAEDHADGEAVVKVAGDRDHPADLGTIDLAEAGEVSGEVVDGSDDPVAGARVAEGSVPTYLPLGPLPRGIVVTDRKGHFVLGGLPAGKVTLEAYFTDLGKASVEGVEVRAGRTTDRVKIVLDGEPAAKRDPKGAASLAVTLGERQEGKGATVVVMMVPPGSEAELAGIEPGDELLAVNGREVRSIEAARRRLTGPLGEDVLLSLRRDEGGGMESWLVRVRRERVRR
ncbi:MAG: carboxypeptidase regulatory-like domain-containing protein [Byssovorax sp.]